jgi:outer membrane protein OmpA-like peptidoglycan-associated protein
MVDDGHCPHLKVPLTLPKGMAALFPVFLPQQLLRQAIACPPRATWLLGVVLGFSAAAQTPADAMLPPESPQEAMEEVMEEAWDMPSEGTEKSGKWLWADRVIAFSSQAGKPAFAARQILGEPQAYPSAGSCGCAWSPKAWDENRAFTQRRDTARAERIRVGFAEARKIRRVWIAESYRPGAIRRAWIHGAGGEKELIYERPSQDARARKALPKSRLLELALSKTAFKVASVSLELDARSEDPPQIDGIAISGSRKAPEFPIRLTQDKPIYGHAQDAGPAINSRFAELMPRFSPEGERLFFVRKDHPENYGGFFNDDIWISRKQGSLPAGVQMPPAATASAGIAATETAAGITDSGPIEATARVWSPAESAGSPLNDAHHNNLVGIDAQGVLTLTGRMLEEGIPAPGLHQRFALGDRWSPPMNLDIEGYFNASPYAEYHMSRDRRVLLMSIEPVDTRGGRDLYVSHSSDQIHWSSPLNLGPVLNTGGDEMAPWLSPDGRTLYFSSNAHRGYGDQDIFRSVRQSEDWTDWSAPENLGPLVNSPAWESHYAESPDGREAWFARVRDALGNTDLMRVALVEDALPPVEEAVVEAAESALPPAFADDLLLFGYIKDGSSGRYIPNAALRFQRADDSLRFVAVEAQNAQYQLRFEQDLEVLVDISAEGYPQRRYTLRIEDPGSRGVRRRDFVLFAEGEDPADAEPQLAIGSTTRIEGLQFRVNSKVISRDSYPALRDWLTLLQAEPEWRITLEGHTNNRCAPRFCAKLSKGRAKAVADWMIDQGLDKNRVSWRGFGATIPVADNETEAGRQRNQRVDIRVD